MMLPEFAAEPQAEPHPLAGPPVSHEEFRLAIVCVSIHFITNKFENVCDSKCKHGATNRDIDYKSCMRATVFGQGRGQHPKFAVKGYF